jgi:hypothetical protein
MRNRKQSSKSGTEEQEREGGPLQPTRSKTRRTNSGVSGGGGKSCSGAASGGNTCGPAHSHVLQASWHICRNQQRAVSQQLPHTQLSTTAAICVCPHCTSQCRCAHTTT